MFRHHCSVPRGRVRQRGAAMAEYLPTLSIGVIVLLLAYQAYGDRIHAHIGEMAQQFATHYYQGWFYPKEAPPESGLLSGDHAGTAGGPLASEEETDSGSSHHSDNAVISGDDAPLDLGLGDQLSDPANPFAPAGSEIEMSTCEADQNANNSASTATTNTTFGNPIDIGNGNKFQQENDYRHPGQIPLQFQRYYNSRQSQALLSLGYGWRHSYQRRLYPLDEQGRIQKGALIDAVTLQAVRDDGSVFFFRKNSQQEKHQQKNTHQDSAQDWSANGAVDKLFHEDSAWIYQTVSNSQEYYDAKGYLQRIVYHNGVIQQLHYNEQQRLIQVSDSRGPNLHLYYSHGWLNKVTLPNGQRVTFDYNDEGQLLSYRIEANNIWKRLRSLWRHSGSRYHYEARHFPNGLTGLTDAEGRRYATWGYDTLGRANLSEHGKGVERLSFDYQDTSTVVMTNAAGHVTTLTLEPARAGHRRLVSMDGQATLNCGATRQQYRYNTMGFLALAVNADGHASRYQRNRRGLIDIQEDGLIQSTQTAQAIQKTEKWQPVEGAHRIEQQWHPRLPLVTRATYKSYIDDQWQPYLQREWIYSDASHLLSRTDTDLSKQNQSYGSQNTNQNLKMAQNRHWAYQYQYHDQALGLVSKIEINGSRQPLADGSDDITAAHFNRNGQLVQLTNALGHTTRVTEYNPQGLPARVTLPDGVQLILKYNDQGNLRQFTRSAGELNEITEFEYDRSGLLTKRIQPDGSWQAFHYNSAHQLIHISNQWHENMELEPSLVSGSWKTKRIYNSDGQLEQHHQRQLDALGRVFKLLGEQSKGTQLGYAPDGQLSTIQEPGNQHPTQHYYDSLNRLTHSIDSLLGKTEIEYGLQRHIRKVTDAEGNTTEYRYNGFSEVIWQRSNATGEQILYRDEAGNVVGVKAPGATSYQLPIQYDVLNRLVSIDYPGERHDVRYTYDRCSQKIESCTGKLVTVIDASGKLEYVYDDLGRIIKERWYSTTGKKSELNPPEPLQYTYGPSGRIADLKYSNGAVAHYEYDKDRLIHITYTDTNGMSHRLVNVASHSAFGLPQALKFGNGYITEKEYDLSGRPKRLKVEFNDESIWTQQYQYDSRNNINLINESIGISFGLSNSGIDNKFEYDALNRLVKESKSAAYDYEYTYDRVGNRKTKLEGSNAIGYKYEFGNKLAKINEQNVVSDNHGNIIASGNGLTLYNSSGRPAAYFEKGKLESAYRYNAFGERTEKLYYSGKSVRYRYNSSGQIIEEYRYGNNKKRLTSKKGKQKNKADSGVHYIWMHGNPIAQIKNHSENIEVIYLHTDHLMTTRFATDSKRNIVWEWKRNAFGEGQPDEDPDNNGTLTKINLRFPGQYYDQESKLFYNYYRYYDPSTGRYTQSDPIGLKGGMNTFTYVNANPVNYIDPLGLYLFAFDGTGNDAYNLGNGNAEAKTNVWHFYEAYNKKNPKEALYLPGVGTSGRFDRKFGGGTGSGSRERINKALNELNILIKNVPDWDRTIDIVGFSRGAAAAREFANEIFQRIDNHHWEEVTECNPINIRFMGLFDTVASMGFAGNITDIGYNFLTDSRIKRVAHAVALNEHRWIFPLQSVAPVAGFPVNNKNVIEQGFIGAHSNIGGGYKKDKSDLSDLTLQWMHYQAKNSGVNIADLNKEQIKVENPIIHDERRGEGMMGALNPNDGDRDIYYPNDPLKTYSKICKRKVGKRCVDWENKDQEDKQKTTPQFENLDHMIIENYDGNIRGEVDLKEYMKWIYKKGVLSGENI